MEVNLKLVGDGLPGGGEWFAYCDHTLIHLCVGLCHGLQCRSESMTDGLTGAAIGRKACENVESVFVAGKVRNKVDLKGYVEG